MNRILAKAWYKNLMDKNPDIHEFDKTTMTYPGTPLAYINN